MKPKKTFQSFSELAEEFDIKYPVDNFQILIRISNSWKHRTEKDYNVTILGATLRYYKSTRSLGIRLSLIGINLNLSIHTKRV